MAQRLKIVKGGFSALRNRENMVNLKVIPRAAIAATISITLIHRETHFIAYLTSFHAANRLPYTFISKKITLLIRKPLDDIFYPLG